RAGHDYAVVPVLAVPGRAEAGGERVAVPLARVGQEAHREPAVRDPRGLLDAVRSHRRDVDGDLPAVEDALERLAESRRPRAAVRDLVVRARVLERLLARPDGAHDLDVLARPPERVPVGNAVPALDHLRPTDAAAEEHAAARELGERGR